MSGSSRDRIHASPSGVRTAVSDRRSVAKAATASRAEIPAQRAKAWGVVAPKTCRCRRASSSRALSGSTRAGGTVQIVGCRAPAHRIRTVPVVAAYLSEFASRSPSASPASPYGIAAPPSWACRRAASCSALSRPFWSSGSLPSENTARSRAAIT